jgi:RNA polymerase sigma-70 factor (ECF subfamily)
MAEPGKTFGSHTSQYCREEGDAMDATDLKTLFRQLREGDEAAFVSIYNALKQPVYTICWRIVQVRETAEDLTQDVFLKLYVSPPAETVKNERAWVFRMAHNASIDALRKSREVQWDGLETGSPEAFASVEQALDLEDAMSRLPDDYRQVLTLHLNAELSFQQIGKLMGLSLSAVYRIYRKAVKLLQQLLNGGAV